MALFPDACAADLMSQPVKYAKLARPRLFDALPRPRLFARLDDLRRQHGVIWIASPPGAGKTTLAASYLRHIDAPSVWCQIDEGDADPATFFFFLAESVPNARKALPWLAPELTGDLQRFARMFFRQYYARLRHGSVVVFDNIQEFDWANAGWLMEIAFGEVPDGVTILALSRDAPAERLARLELGGQLVTLSWNELRLDAAESRALAQIDDGTDPEQLAWLEQIDGWAAGVVMLREHVARRRDNTSMPFLDGRETVFRYFAGEILGRMPQAWQHQLLLLSSLPGITADDAERLTGDPDAAHLLNRLYRDRLFVDRRGPAPYTYHLHALFREYLQYEAQQRLAAEERNALRHRAASILDDQGRTDEAARLYRGAGAYKELAVLLLRSASPMLAAGRGQSWREWMGWLPDDLTSAEPWLWYWQGMSLAHAEPRASRDLLAKAHRAFRETGNVQGRLRAIAAIIDSYFFEWSDFHALPEWIDVMLDAMPELDPDTIDPLADLQIHSGLTLALFLIVPDSPLLPKAAQRALNALARVESPAERLAAGANLMFYLNWANAGAARALTTGLDKLVDDTSIAPFYRISWCRVAVYRHQLDGDYATAQKLNARAQQLAADFGLMRLQFQLDFRTGLSLLATGESAGAATLLAHMRRTISPVSKLEFVYLRLLEASYFSQTNALEQALQAANDTVRIGDESRLAATMRWQMRMLLAYCSAQAGDLDAGAAWADKAVENAYGPDKESAKEERDYLLAYVDYARGDFASAAALLKELLRKQRERRSGFPMGPRLVPYFAGTLLLLALREGIETDLARNTIVSQRFASPDRFAPEWPWPVGVRTFGKFELSLNGAAFRASGKAQQRPMALLKALVDAGDAGRTQQALTTQLWPEANDPKSALNVTVHRLRKLLGHDDAVIVSGGKVCLHEVKVWSDVAALADLCKQVDNLPDSAPVSEAQRLSAALTAVYQGPFCDGEEDGWLLAARDRWRTRFLSAAGRLGQLLEQAGEWMAAHHLYSRALEAEPLAESIYRGLMRCACGQSDPAAAMSAYRRCRETLSVVLGRQPSLETERLAASLGLKGSRHAGV